MTLRAAVVDTPIGALTLVASDAGLARIRFDPSRWPAVRPARDPARTVTLDEDPRLADAAARLLAFLGDDPGDGLPDLNVPLDLTGVPPFARDVYAALRRVGPGALTTYGHLARQVGDPAAARAVGGALNRNPLPIVVPCHRVVAADGSLGGYAGGLDLKRWLLSRERPHAVPIGGWAPSTDPAPHPDTQPTLPF